MAGLSTGLGLVKPPNQIARFKPEDQLQLVTPNTPETDAATIQRAREVQGDFSSGLYTGARGLAAGAKAFVGQAARTVGAEEYGQDLIDEAGIDSINAQTLAPRVNRLSDVTNFGDAVDYAQAMAGQGSASLIPQVIVGAGTRGLGAARGFGATAASILPSTAGDALMRINADPATAGLSDAEKMAIITGEGGASAALESIVPAAIGRRVVGAGAKLAKPTVANVAGGVVKDLGTEAATEGAQQVLGQQVQGALNPNRDTSRDMEDVIEAGAAGFFGAGPVSVGGAALENTLGRSIQAGKEIPTTIGKINKFTTPDLTNLRKPQTAPPGVDVDQWLTEDDNSRNQSATKIAEVLTKATDASQRLKTAASDYLKGSRTEAAWEDLSGAIKNEERIQKVKDGVQAFAESVGKRVKAGVDTAKADLKARQNKETVIDPFDRLLSDNLFASSNLIDGDEIINELPALTTGMRGWIESDFGIKDGANVMSAPEGLSEVFDNPSQAVTDAYKLMVRQGLVEDNPKLLKQVTQALDIQAQQYKKADKIVADNILPTAQSEYNLDDNDYNLIAGQLRDMLKSGKINEKALDALFGPKKEVVLEALRPTIKTLSGVMPDVDETEVTTDDVNVTDSDSLSTNKTEPNTVEAKVKYTGEYDSSVPASASAAEIAEGKYKTAGGQAVSRTGIVDSLREKYGDRPEKLVEEVQKKLARYNLTSDKELNRRVFTLKLEDANDSTEEIDIPVDSLKSITPGTTNNVWAVNTGRNGEYGDVTKGVLYFERVAPDGTVKQFATTTSKLIRHARAARGKGGVVTDKTGVADQLAMLKAGIASMLNVKNTDGTDATSGRFGFMMAPSGDVTWATSKTKLPKELKLMGSFTAGVESVADKAKILEEDLAELRDWVNNNNNAKWTDGNAKSLDREKPGPARDYLIQQRDLATLVQQANAATRNPTLENVSTVLKNIDEYVYNYRDERDNKVAAGTKKVNNEDVAITETDEMVDAAEKKLENKIRTNDEQTGELVQPPIAKANPNENKDNKRLGEQVAYLTKILDKGIPAFNAFIKTLTPPRVATVRRTLVNMLEGKLPDGLHARAQRALDSLGKEPPPDKPTRNNEENTTDEAKRIRNIHFRANYYRLAGTINRLTEQTKTDDSDIAYAENKGKTELAKTLKEQYAPVKEKIKTAEAELAALLKANSDLEVPSMSNKEQVKQVSNERPADPADVKTLSKEEQDKIRAEIIKKLGPDMKVEFAKSILGAPRPDRAGPQISGEWTEGLIRISLNARDPAQVGAHESMHEFFSRLNKSELRDATKSKEILLRAASNPIVVRQVERLLAGSPNAIKQIQDGEPDFMEERLAYMYQFWHAGLIKLGPDTTNIFERIAAFIRRTITKLSDAEKADAILQAFDRGELKTADAAAKVLAENIELKERQAQEAMAIFDPVTKRLARFFLSAEANLIESDNPHLQKILTQFKNPTGVGVEQSLIEAKTQKMAQFTNKLQQVIGDADKTDLEEAVKHLHAGTKPTDKKILDIRNGVRGLLDDIETYMRGAKVQRLTEDGKWEDFGHIKNYYPRAFDVSAMTKDPAGFIDDLMLHHKPELEAIAKQANKELEAGLKTDGAYASALAKKAGQVTPITAQQIAEAITNRLINSMGQTELSEDERAVGHSPNTRAINKRSLKWLDVSKFGKWMNNDLVEVMTTYIAQGAKRAETTRRFGNNSIELTKAVNKAYEYERQKVIDAQAISTKKTKLTAEEIDAKALDNMAGPVKDIMALEGTIGYDINPRLQRLQGTILVYENLRTLGLSLFAQMVDPLGIMVRGGTMKEAFATYSRGLKEIKASWTGKKIEDRETEIAEFLGTVDSSGFLANFGQSYSSMYIHQKARKWNEALFRYNGMDGFNRATRIMATQAAISFIKRQKTDPTHNTARYLEELVLKPEDIKIDDKGELDYADPKIQVAVKRWVDQAILRPNAAQRPAWMSDPHFALFGHMKQFSYSFHDVILKRAWLEAKNHGDLGPLGILMAGFVPTMIAADAAKAILLTGKEPYWMAQGLPSMIEHGVQRAGLLGIAQPYADPVTSGHTFSVLGPAGEQAISLFTQPFEDSAVEALPGASIINTMNGPKTAAAS